MTSFGLSFGLNEESQLHGTITGLSSLSSSAGSSSALSTSSPASVTSGPSSVSAAPISSTTAAVPLPTPSTTPLATTSSSVSIVTATANSPSSSSIPPLSSSSPTSFKATSYEPHSRLIAGYPRLTGFYGSTYAAAAAAGDQNGSLYPANSTAASFYPTLSTHYELDKSNGNSWSSLGSQTPYSPYDPHHSFYSPYSNCYGAIDSAARRKNATRETTNTLKAWLYEHRKNPYPTKGEKIMLAIITKMTLTQVSTWFANARRRLKKENKMTWEPKNKSTDSRDDSDKDSCKDIDDDLCDKNDNGNGLRNGLKEDRVDKGHLLSNHSVVAPVAPPPLLGQSFGGVEGDNIDGQRPKIWSLAQTATSETTSLAGRLYPDWSAAAAYAQFGSAANDQLLINPLAADPYHHHHHHHHQAQHVQSPPGFYHQKPVNSAVNSWNEEPPLPPPPPPVPAAPQAIHHHHHHHQQAPPHLTRNNGNRNFSCSPVSFLPSNLKIHI